MDDVNKLTNKGLENGKVDLSKWPEEKASRVVEAMRNLGDAICKQEDCRPEEVVLLPLNTVLGLRALAAYHELERIFNS